MLPQKQFGMTPSKWRDDARRPTFETLDDLNRGSSVLEDAFSIPSR
jgi:phosphoenolpyruvate carboxylase